MGVVAISMRLHEGVTHYHAQIGGDVPAVELTRLEGKLMKEASKAVYAQQWDEALNLFTHGLAVSEKTKSSADPGTRGTYVHNIGFCLHCMGEFEAAKAYYEQSIECLQKVEVPMSQKILNGVLYPERLVFEFLYGGLNANRIAMTKERILDLTFNRKPDLKVLDGYGRKKTMPGTKADPMSGRAEPQEPEGTPQPSGSALWEREGRAPHPTGCGGGGGGGGGASSAVSMVATAPRPSWLTAATHAADEPDIGARSAPHAGRGCGEGAAEQELARKEWLDYYCKTGDFDKAEELVVTAEEAEDLDYLRQRVACR